MTAKQLKKVRLEKTRFIKSIQETISISTFTSGVISANHFQSEARRNHFFTIFQIIERSSSISLFAIPLNSGLLEFRVHMHQLFCAKLSKGIILDMAVEKV